jgi:hypothetical protein
MSAYDFVQEQLRESFETASRLTAELVLLRDRLVRAEIKIQRLEEALDIQKSEHVMASESGVIGKSDTVITKQSQR